MENDEEGDSRRGATIIETSGADGACQLPARGPGQKFSCPLTDQKGRCRQIRLPNSGFNHRPAAERCLGAGWAKSAPGQRCGLLLSILSTEQEPEAGGGEARQQGRCRKPAEPLALFGRVFPRRKAIPPKYGPRMALALFQGISRGKVRKPEGNEQAGEVRKCPQRSPPLAGCAPEADERDGEKQHDPPLSPQNRRSIIMACIHRW